MADTKMTRKEALQNAIALCDGETREVLEHMLAQITKPRVRKPDTTKRDANIALGEQFAEAWNGETFKASDVAQALNVSVAKASAICKVMGWVEVPTTEKVKVYSL